MNAQTAILTNTADTQNEGPIKWPIALEIEGQRFQVHAVNTRVLWKLFGRYEGLFLTIADRAIESESGVPAMGVEESDRLIDMMFDLCELATKVGGDGGRVNMDTDFQQGSQVPKKLALALAERLFGPFLAEREEGRYLPLAEVLAKPLINAN